MTVDEAMEYVSANLQYVGHSKTTKEAAETLYSQVLRLREDRIILRRGIEARIDIIKAAEAEVGRLRGCIVDCLNENGHLADGDCCTLIDLKRAVPEWGLE